MADETANVKLEADNKSFIKAFNEASEAVGNLKGGIMSMVHGVDYAKSHMESYVQSTIKGWTQIGAAALAAGAITTGTLGVATHNFAKFEEQMANVSTVMSGSMISLERMGELVMDLTQEFPQSAEELAVGLYAVNSAGYQAKDAIKVLQATARYSTAALTDMQSSVNAVTGILHAYGLEASDAAMVTDVMFKAVEVGQMTGAEFTQQIGDWASIASTMGVSFQSAAAAMAVLTTTGALPTAQAATSLASVLNSLMKPTDEMTRSFEKLGVASGKQAIETWGLAETMQRLWIAAGQNETVFAKMLGDREAIKGALTMVGKGYEDLIKYQDMFNDSSRTAGTTQRAFAKQMDSVNNQLKLLRNGFRQMTYETGLIVGPWIKILLQTVNTLVRGVNSLPTPIRRFVGYLQLALPIMGGLAMLGGVIMLNSVKTMLAVGALTKMAAVAKAVHLFGLATSLEKVAVFIKGGILKNIAKQLMAIIHLNGASVTAWLKSAGAALKSVAVYAALAVAIYLVYQAWGDAKKQASDFYDAIGDSSKLQSMYTMQAGLEKVYQRLRDISYIANDSTIEKIGLSLEGTFQVLTPFTDNTVMNDIEMFKAGRKEAKAYEDQMAALNAAMNRIRDDKVLSKLYDAYRAAPTAEEGQKYIDMMSSNVIQAIDAAEADGRFSWEAYIKTVEMIAKTDAEIAFDKKIGADIPDDLQSKSDQLQLIFTEMNVVLEEYVRQIRDKVAAEHAATASTSKLTLALLKFNDPISTASEKLEAYNTILNETIGLASHIADAQAKAAGAFEDLGAAIRENGAEFDLTTEKGQALQASISTANSALQELMAVSYETTGSMKSGEAARDAYAQGLINMAREANYTDEQLTNLLTVMGYTPDEIVTAIQLSGDQEAMKMLIAIKLFMAAMDGYSIQMKIYVDTIEGGGVGVLPKLPTLKDAQDQAAKIIGMVATPDPEKASKTSSGGGGGEPKWSPSRSQLANMKKALSTPIVNMLTGTLGQAWQKQMITQWFDGITANVMSEGKTRVGASILEAAKKSGSDPAEEIASYVEAYNRLVKASSKAAADIAVNQFNSLEDFQTYVDAIEAMLQHQQDIEDWKYGREEIGFAEYSALLQQRLAKYAEYTDEWMALTDQIAQVEQDRLSEERRLASVKLAIGLMSKEEYKSILMAQLADAELYSAQWFSLWDEINRMNEDQTSALDDQANSIKDFADAVKSAFEDIKHSVEDPMLKATSMVAAFGDQTGVTMGQVQGFYEHMMGGTARWIDTIKQLKAKGINGSFLKELISAGPQSLGFAESILALGDEGIGFINTSMADIAAMASGLGTDIANSQTGTVIQGNDNSVSIVVGDITIQGQLATGVTVADIQAAVAAALAAAAAGVQNGQPAGVFNYGNGGGYDPNSNNGGTRSLV